MAEFQNRLLRQFILVDILILGQHSVGGMEEREVAQETETSCFSP